jgi:hypothetical protein
MKIFDYLSGLWSRDDKNGDLEHAFAKLQKMYPEFITDANIAYFGRDIRVELSNGRIIRLRGLAAKLKGEADIQVLIDALEDAIAQYTQLPEPLIQDIPTDDKDDSTSLIEESLSYLAVATGGVLLGHKSSDGEEVFYSGKVFDDPISGAQLYIEKEDGSLEELEGILTGEDGSFSFPKSMNHDEHNLVAKGGTNTATGLENTMVLKAPPTATVINPITTLLVEITDKTNLSLADAEAKILEVFGFNLPEGKTLLDFDPISKLNEAQDQANQQAEENGEEPVIIEPSIDDIAFQQLSSSLMVIMSELSSHDPIGASIFFEMLAMYITKSTQPIELDNPVFLEKLMIGFDEQQISGIVDSLSLAITNTENATNFEQIALVQQAFLDGEPALTPTILIDNLSGGFSVDTGADVIVSVDGVELENDALLAKFATSVSLESETTIYTPVDGAFLGGEQIVITATLTDADGSISESVSQNMIAIDNTAPEQTTFAVEDNVGLVKGILESGDVTDDQRIVLRGICEEGSSIELFNGELSLGHALVTGTQWTMTVNVSDDSMYSLRAQETDKYGLVGALSDSFIIQGDMVAPETPELFVPGTYYRDTGITQVSGVNPITITNLEAGATVRYKVSSIDENGGVSEPINWSDTYQQPLHGGLYNVAVQQIDNAGNVSDTSEILLDVDEYSLFIGDVNFYDTDVDPLKSNDIGFLNDEVDTLSVELGINQLSVNDSFELLIDGVVVATDSPTQAEIDAGVMIIETSIDEQQQDPDWQIEVVVTDSNNVTHSDQEDITWG